MDEKDFQYEVYEEIQHNMKFVLKSKSRIAIMNQLFLSPSTKKELKDATGLSSSDGDLAIEILMQKKLNHDQFFLQRFS